MGGLISSPDFEIMLKSFIILLFCLGVYTKYPYNFIFLTVCEGCRRPS
jgi:hypothetical protein